VDRLYTSALTAEFGELWQSSFEVKRSKLKATIGGNVKIVFGAYPCKQKAQMSQRDRSMLRVIEYFANSLQVIQAYSK